MSPKSIVKKQENRPLVSNEKGEPIFKTKTYANVIETVTADQLHQVAQALASLSNYPLSGVERNDVFELIG